MSVANQYSEKVLEQIDSFLITPGWSVIKYRLLYMYKANLQDKLNSRLRANKVDEAQYLLGMMDCLNEVVGITERLGKEINKGQLDVDEALHVIENKRG